MSKTGIPESWAEADVATVCLVNPKHKDIEENLEVGFVPMALVSENGLLKGHEVRKWSQVKKGFTHFADTDVIFAKITPCMENKKSAIVRNLPNGVGCGSTEFHVFRANRNILPEYLLSFFRQDSFIRNAESNMTGSAGQKRVPTTWMVQQQLPIPPLGEQKRIVAKIESTQEKIKTIEQSVTKAEELIGKYREALLQKAFRGELAPQDPNDEPASKLLERIRADRAKQTDGKKKKKGDLPPINPEEIPFGIPKSWEWVRLSEIADQIQYGYTTSSAQRGSHRFLRITDITRDGVNWDTVPFCSPSSQDAKALALLDGDILFARTGGTVGKSYLIKGAPSNAIFASYLIKVRPKNVAVKPEYLNQYFSSPTYWDFVTNNQRGAAQPNINGTTLGNLLIPLPPYEEQSRVVAHIKDALVNISMIEDHFLKLVNFQKYLLASILSEAFSGRLVPQVASEGTGHELLEKIKQSTQSESVPMNIRPTVRAKVKKKTRTKK